MSIKIIGIAASLLIFFLLEGSGISQSSRCVVAEIHDNMALVTCEGGGTQNIDMGGKANMYKAGDIVEVPNVGTTGRTQGADNLRPSTERTPGKTR